MYSRKRYTNIIKVPTYLLAILKLQSFQIYNLLNFTNYNVAGYPYRLVVRIARVVIVVIIFTLRRDDVNIRHMWICVYGFQDFRL